MHHPATGYQRPGSEHRTPPPCRKPRPLSCACSSTPPSWSWMWRSPSHGSGDLDCVVVVMFALAALAMPPVVWANVISLFPTRSGDHLINHVHDLVEMATVFTAAATSTVASPALTCVPHSEKGREHSGAACGAALKNRTCDNPRLQKCMTTCYTKAHGMRSQQKLPIQK